MYAGPDGPAGYPAGYSVAPPGHEYYQQPDGGFRLRFAKGYAEEHPDAPGFRLKDGPAGGFERLDGAGGRRTWAGRKDTAGQGLSEPLWGIVPPELEAALRARAAAGGLPDTRWSRGDVAIIRPWGPTIRKVCELLAPATAHDGDAGGGARRAALVEGLLTGFGFGYTEEAYGLAFRRALRDRIIEALGGMPPDAEATHLRMFLGLQPDQASKGRLFSVWREERVAALTGWVLTPVPMVKVLKVPAGFLKTARDTDGAIRLSDKPEDDLIDQGGPPGGLCFVDDKAGGQAFDRAQALDYSAALGTEGATVGGKPFERLAYFFEDEEAAREAAAFLGRLPEAKASRFFVACLTSEGKPEWVRITGR